MREDEPEAKVKGLGIWLEDSRVLGDSLHQWVLDHSCFPHDGKSES